MSAISVTEPSGAPAVELHDAAVALGGREIVSGVELALGAGEFLAVLGANGAGKSTLMRAILGAVPLLRGTVSVFGRPPAQSRSAVGYLPQRRSFDSAVRVRGADLVALGLDGTRWGVPLALTPRARNEQRARARQVAETIALVGAEAYAERPIGELSGGEQQRLLIAQALVRRPRLLILDEPLDSLDLPNQAAVAGLVSRISRASGVSVLLVAHDVNPLLGYLDGVLYLAGGRAVTGSVREVITAPTLSRLYGLPIEVLTAADGRRVVVGTPEAPHHHGHRHAHP